MVKLLIVIMLLLIAGSLFSALYYLMKGDNSEKTVKALTWRISLSLGLFLLLMLGFYLGVIGHPNPTPL
ncbi:MAG: twin transmembrane helix small protein [Methylophilales bacterium]|nr:twin transmembrane helix small protein [Methylophilales bacterium]